MNLEKSTPVNLTKDDKNQANLLKKSTANDNPTLISLNKFDQQLDKIATTLNLFESQLQNVNQQIKDLEKLAVNQANDIQNLPQNLEEIATHLNKKPSKRLTSTTGKKHQPPLHYNKFLLSRLKLQTEKMTYHSGTLSKFQFPQAQQNVETDEEREKRKLVEVFNSKVENIQNIQDMLMTTAKNIYFVSIPICMMLTMAYPTETKKILTGVEGFKTNVSSALEGEGTVKEKFSAVNKVVEETFFEDDADEHRRRQRMLQKKPVAAPQNAVNKTAATAEPKKAEPKKTK
jgi:hypothetical protein